MFRHGRHAFLLFALVVFSGCTGSPGTASPPLVSTSARPLSGIDLPTCPPPPAARSVADRSELQALMGRQTKRTGAAREAFDRWHEAGLPLAWSARTDEWLLEAHFVPPRAARALALVHVAIHDALVAADRERARYRRTGPWVREPRLATTDVSVPSFRYPSEGAVVAAAWRGVMGQLVPDASVTLDAEVKQAVDSELDLGVSAPTDVAAGLELGSEVARRVLAARDDDGSDRPATASLEPAPGRWGNRAAMEPYAGSWKPWWIGRGDRFRISGVATASDELQTELAEVRREVESLSRFPWKLDQATFWNFDVPAILWSQEARRLLASRAMSDRDRARILAELATVEADAFIAAWDTKYTVLRPRPAQVDPGLSALMPFATPPHPSFPSGHAVASMAAAIYLSAVFPDESRHVRDLANQAAMSRLYAGIHFASDNLAGLGLGEQVGRAVLLALPEPRP